MPKGKGAGAKPKYTVEQVCRALNESRGMITMAAEGLGCTPKTIHNYIDQHVKIKELLETHRERRVDRAEFKLDDKVDEGDIGAIKFVLSTIGKSRGYGDESKVNLNVEDNRDAQVASVLNLLRQTRDRLLDENDDA